MDFYAKACMGTFKLTSIKDRYIIVFGTFCIFLCYALFIFNSDVAYLAFTQPQDDSFYYFLPAWNFKAYGFYTFDGLNETYGFQPLWMVLLTIMAFFISSKILFFKLSLLVGCLFYLLTGLIIYKISKLLIRQRLLTFIPWFVWVSNIYLLRIFASGKENSLSVFLYALIALSLLNIHFKNRQQSSLYGLIDASFMLVRINNLMFVGPILLYRLYHNRQQKSQIGFYLATFSLVLSLWFGYSYAAFGTLFPNSGSLKTVISKPSIVYWLNQQTGVELGGMLSSQEQLLLQHPEFLDVPRANFFWQYLSQIVPQKVTDIYFDQKFSSITLVSTLNQVLLLSIGLGLIGFLGGLWQRSITINQQLIKLLSYCGIIALANSVVNWLFFQRYLSFTIWYPVPELFWFSLVLGLLVVASIIGWQQLSQIKPIIKPVQYIMLLAIGIFLLSPLSRFPQELLPQKTSEHYRGTYRFFSYIWQDEALKATSWANQALAPNTTIGSWNAGIVGYFYENGSTINLDGLANSPAFVDEVLRQNILFTRGLANENVLWNYIQHQDIRYIIDSWYSGEMGKSRFINSIPPEHYEIIYEGAVTFSDGNRPDRRMYVLKLKY
ncbi:MAG TPA: hypothetical protein DEF47_04350 [Herpetosiphon sp.]|uniref:Glycosyltransferase RgtA/B/C/D-like domain-containing protein n=1 Tax=Herpetosiphon aurantiacus (strain ATCC 23779 / DSM 785 / 114-95) TaxID=316274 RepID=A9B5D6_HERA2|nr:hypothetical protein [Herpetosiphon sp.]ABX02761.1 hypothetical protein Haur_0109 [Herpetosiphon aurantiacus DSM 785]HBW49116.1 hypothetical protein [Herpetosiphon sp.]